MPSPKHFPDEAARQGGGSVVESPVQFTAVDGHAIGGTHFTLAAERRPTHAVVFNTGAGIAARNYGNFAKYLAANGIAVLAYDYRGIGLSAPPTLRGFPAMIEDWSEYDCAAALDWMAARHRGVPLIGVGHSVGSLLFGGAPNSSLLNRLVMIAPHTGYYGDYRRGYRLPMAALWHGLMPVLTSLVGYFPGRRLGLGEDLPGGVAMQWARRRKPVFQLPASTPADDRMRLLVARFDSAAFDALLLTIADDAFATVAAAHRVRELLPNLRAEHRLVAPAQAGLARLGHFGFFRRDAAALWPVVLRHLRGEREPNPAP